MSRSQLPPTEAGPPSGSARQHDLRAARGGREQRASISSPPENPGSALIRASTSLTGQSRSPTRHTQAAGTGCRRLPGAGRSRPTPSSRPHPAAAPRPRCSAGGSCFPAGACRPPTKAGRKRRPEALAEGKNKQRGGGRRRGTRAALAPSDSRRRRALAVIPRPPRTHVVQLRLPPGRHLGAPPRLAPPPLSGAPRLGAGPGPRHAPGRSRSVPGPAPVVPSPAKSR